MSKLICNNPECKSYGKIEENLKNSYTLIDGELVNSKLKCPACGKSREEHNPNSEIPLSDKNFEVGKYSSANTEDKKRILKERSHSHYQKEIKPYKEHKLNEVITQFRDVK